MSQPQLSVALAAQQKYFVTFTMPITSPDAPTVTTHEAKALLASSGTTGFRTWEAALYLGCYLSSKEGSALVNGMRVLELGAGTGFVSTLCAMHLGAKYVLATDGSVEVVEDLSSNIFLNDPQGSLRMSSMLLEWGWSSTSSDAISDPDESENSFDLILGADVVGRIPDAWLLFRLVHSTLNICCRHTAILG